MIGYIFAIIASILSNSKQNLLYHKIGLWMSPSFLLGALLIYLILGLQEKFSLNLRWSILAGIIIIPFFTLLAFIFSPFFKRLTEDLHKIVDVLENDQ